jgi:hypothetical protein
MDSHDLALKTEGITGVAHPTHEIGREQAGIRSPVIVLKIVHHLIGEKTCLVKTCQAKTAPDEMWLPGIGQLQHKPEMCLSVTGRPCSRNEDRMPLKTSIGAQKRSKWQEIAETQAGKACRDLQHQEEGVA